MDFSWSSSSSSLQLRQCILPLTSMQTALILIFYPFVFLVLLLLSFVLLRVFRVCLAKVRRGSVSQTRAQDINQFVRTLMALLCFSYTSISSSVYSVLNCVPVNPADEDPVRVLYTLPDIQCGSAEHNTILLIAYPMLGLVLSFPMLGGYFLYRAHKRDLLHTLFYRQRFGTLYEKYANWHGKIADLVRRGLLSGFSVAFWTNTQQLFMWRVVLIYLFSVFHAATLPFGNSLANGLEMLSLGILFAVLVVTYNTQGYEVYIGVCVISFAAMLLAIVLLQTLMNKTRALFQRCACCRCIYGDGGDDTLEGGNNSLSKKKSLRKVNSSNTSSSSGGMKNKLQPRHGHRSDDARIEAISMSSMDFDLNNMKHMTISPLREMQEGEGDEEDGDEKGEVPLSPSNHL